MPEAVAAEHPIEVVWKGDRLYAGGSSGGPVLELDGDRQTAASPVEAVLVALGSCAAIDVVDILKKRRTPPSSLRVRLNFARAADPPRRLTAVRVTFHIATDSERPHVERAIRLSFDKYCSVASSLAADLVLTWELELSPAEVAATE